MDFADDEKGELVDLIFQTYYMVDWKTTQQSESDELCMTCGGKMTKVGPLLDRNGMAFDGLACHHCKSIFWVRRQEGKRGKGEQQPPAK